MNRTVAIILIILAFGLGAGAGAGGILYSTGNLVEPSRSAGEVAPTLSLDSPTATPGAAEMMREDVAALSEKIDALSTQVALLGTAVAEGSASAAASAPETATTEAAAEAEAEASAAGAGLTGRALYRISEDDSEARFLIDEVLSGDPITVVGATQRVAGDIIVNFDDPAASQIGTIAINARTLRTDNDFRNQAIRSRILQTDTYEFINFEPLELIDLDAAPAAVGDTAEFQVRGNLTIREVTREVVFDASVTLSAADQISGSARATITVEEYGLVINAPPLVADIGETITLEIDFVANLVEAQ